MKINIVVPPFDSVRFSGGIWCVMQHARQLALRGHEVRVVPIMPCAKPLWFPQPWPFEFVAVSPSTAAWRAVLALARAAGAAIGYAAKDAAGPGAASQESKVRALLAVFSQGFCRYNSYGHRQGAALDALQRNLPPADITIATDAETAWPVRLFGSGELVYFSQHDETFFWEERLAGEASRREAESSYRLGLHQLANSPWLQQRLQEAQPGQRVALCPNAIDHQMFRGEPRQRRTGEALRIISYGGRQARWKGFADMCQALRLLGERRPDIVVEWSVYGAALLPPDNPVFPYRHLGFLQPETLAAAYREQHLMLSASWYESFPLFPIEAMATGIAVITTQPGTELYARDQETVLIVTPRDVSSIAAAVERLADDEALRLRLAHQGRAASLSFDWTAAGDVMERALVGIYQGRSAAPVSADAALARYPADSAVRSPVQS